MIQLIVNASVEKEKTGAVSEILYASSNHEKVKAKYEELGVQYLENYVAVYDLPLDTDLDYWMTIHLYGLGKKSLSELK